MQRSRGYLYDRFKNNQKPNGDDFRDLIDSSYNEKGWYYFLFLPHSISGANGFEMTNSNAFHLYKHERENNSADGIVNILLPKGVSRIISLQINGKMNIRGGNMRLDIFLSKYTNESSRLISLDDEIKPIIRDTVGSHILGDELIPVNQIVDSGKDAVFLQIESFTEHIINNNFNTVAITTIGIEFA